MDNLTVSQIILNCESDTYVVIGPTEELVCTSSTSSVQDIGNSLLT